MSMRIFLAFWITAGAASAAVSNARVMGVTSTQAVLSYTAPDTAACTVAVSTAAGFAPLANDVNPSLFEGANQDSRPGNISTGRARIFVVGKREVATSGGANYSRALQAATLHYFRITCPSDGSTYSGTFTTATILGGSGYGDPIPMDPANPGNYLYPTFSATDRSAAVVEPHTGALVKNLYLAADVQSRSQSDLGSSGSGKFCAPKPVKLSDSDKYGYHCQVLTGGVPALYWIAPSDGETRFLGVMSTNANTGHWNATNWCHGALGASFDETDPNVFYCNVMDAGTGEHLILKGTYTGHNAAGQDADLTNQPYFYYPNGTPHTTWTQMLPYTRGLRTMQKEFDPNFAAYGDSCCTSFKASDWGAGRYAFSWQQQQDAFGFIGVFDPHQTAAMQQAQYGSTAGCLDNPPVTGSTYSGQPGCIVGSTGSFTGGPGSALRWSVLHTVLGSPGPTVGVSENVARLIAGFAYQVTLTSSLSATRAPCTAPKPNGNPITDWPDATWTAGCYTFTVSGDPRLP